MHYNWLLAFMLSGRKGTRRCPDCRHYYVAHNPVGCIEAGSLYAEKRNAVIGGRAVHWTKPGFCGCTHTQEALDAYFSNKPKLRVAK